MMHFAQIMQRAFNTPLLVEPSKAQAFLSGLGPRLSGGEVTLNGVTVSAEAMQPAMSTLGGERQDGRLYPVTGSVAVIGVTGTLVHRGAWIGESSGLTSYEGIARQLQAALDDPQVRGIALDIDSFGGQVSGAFDLADRIRDVRGVKPIRAFVGEHALSGGYVIASQADQIIIPRTGAVGSIGVITMHADMSRALENQGVAVTLIHAGAHKADGNPYAPLPDDVRESVAVELEEVRQLFARTVAAGRGDRMDSAAALATEARIYRGADAVAAGLADQVAAPVEAFNQFVAEMSGAIAINRKDHLMDATTNDPAITADAPQAGQSPVEAVAIEAPAAPAAVPPAAASPETIRAEAAEVAQACAQAARLGVNIDVSQAIASGTRPDAIRASVLSELAARGDAAGIVASAPAAVPKESPIVAAARKAAAAKH